MTDIPLLQENVPLAPYTTLGVGGPARYLAHARTEEEVLGVLDLARRQGHNIFVLGGGSNVVISDHGFPGVVLRMALTGIETDNGHGSDRIRAAAGEDWDAFVDLSVRRNLAGLECLSGIPGTVGGTPVQNVGAYGQEVSDSIRSVRVVDRASLCVLDLQGQDCGFGYRTSIFNTTERDRYIVLSVSFELSRRGGVRLKYADLERYFAGRAGTPSLDEVRQAVLDIRYSKAMRLVAGDPDARSAGSFFKNPVITEGVARSVEEHGRGAGSVGSSESLPGFPAPDGKVKIPAAWLIEHAGFRKGYTDGCVGLSTKHALALVNRGCATSADILRLMRKIQAEVQRIFGLELVPEPVFVGFE